MNEGADASTPAPAAEAPAGEALAGSAPAGEATISRRVVICNTRGLHARAAAKLVTTAERFSANIDVVRDGQVVPARSIMGLMFLGAGKGADIELVASGWDAHEALEALVALIEAGFHEQD